jgi:hypothetical protein
LFDLLGFGADIFERSEFSLDVEDSFDGFLLLVFHVGDFGLDGLGDKSRATLITC